ncbi:septal ring lytic transglycosylase RlpA family protein [Phragmitibacter flavus]|uniref:Probable endolytic peptidoglycan transglycosylase RlpA n=1 Tax=Phragmitibacter flavus TaxID=2576071 RepID=A0A5R8KJD5_9BACT|nr:septal ring lytic transglycosylase RlpA family protein [Phragmitibacter flavus]TLD72045.1 septal ring lytic transglycosylase RlpA family protein [Phragmitibacter flavus]
MLILIRPTPRFTSVLLATIGLFLISGKSTTLQATSADSSVYRGKASFYGGYWHGRKTANGEIYDQNTLTAAHPTLRFGTKVLVKNLRNGREVTLRINNRGPYVKGRIIDVSTRAARELRMTNAGVVAVEVTVLPKDQPVAVTPVAPEAKKEEESKTETAPEPKSDDSFSKKLAYRRLASGR